MTSTPRVQRLHGGNPILRRIEGHPWENRVAFNPACAFVDERHLIDAIVPSLPLDGPTKSILLKQDGLCFLLYRAQGARQADYDHTRSSMGLAVLSPRLDLLARHDKPVILPDQPYEDLGVEVGPAPGF